MKAFDQYLVEAEKEYAFRLRVATDLEEGAMDRIENRLKKYEAFLLNIRSALNCLVYNGLHCKSVSGYGLFKFWTKFLLEYREGFLLEGQYRLPGL